MAGDLITYNYDINTGGWSNTWGTYHSCCGSYGYCTCGSKTIVWSTYPTKEYVYLYQVKCPAENCGKTNWLELDKIVECTNCKAKLKAVSQKVDHEIQIED